MNCKHKGGYKYIWHGAIQYCICAVCDEELGDKDYS